ncbi:hypothetical protein HanPSC8_Chr04g0182731 [Helianthus annuus]|nr:hypothetical protein HanPSC8_Chr04g0182731 [Helianthus annuus]
MLLLEWVLLLTVKAPSWNYKERRYAIFDFVTSENCQKSKIFFIAWLVFSFSYMIHLHTLRKKFYVVNAADI